MSLLVTLVIAAGLCFASVSALALDHHTRLTQTLRRRLHEPDGGSTVQVDVNDTMATLGWISVRIRKGATGLALSADDPMLWYAAGYYEARQLQVRIWQHWTNTVKPTGDAVLAPEIVAWLNTNIAFLKQRVEHLNETDSFWRHAGLLMVQLQGLADGYNAANPPSGQSLSFFDFFVLNYQFELEDLDGALNIPVPPLTSYLYTRGGCTAYVKPVTGGDLYVAHTTWTNYRTMLRVVRDFDLGGTAVRFSGYPGLIHSGDDFYMTSRQLVVMETTIILLRNSIYQFVQHQSVPEFLRVMIANHLGTDGNSWTNSFARYNSGTYNNEYMVVDLSKYTLGVAPKALPDDFLWVVEQLPGMTPMNDVTVFVRKNGYWGSYNRAYFDETYNVSGLRDAGLTYGSYFTHDQSPRAQIMRREDQNVQNLTDVMHLIRFNEWQNDPLSVCPGCSNPNTNPFLALAARGDLVPHAKETSLGVWGPTGFIGPAMPFGSTDAKVTSYSLATDPNSPRGAWIISGPTNQDQPDFQWSTSYVNQGPGSSHVGQPDLFNFPWVETSAIFKA